MSSLDWQACAWARAAGEEAQAAPEDALMTRPKSDTATVVLSANDLYRQAVEVAVLTVGGHLVSPAVVGLVHPRAGLLRAAATPPHTASDF